MAKTTTKKKATRKKSTGAKKKRTPAQIAAFKKMIAARNKKAKPAAKKKAAPKKKTTAPKATKKVIKKTITKKTTTSTNTGASMAKRKKRSSGTKRKAVASVGRKAGAFMKKSNATIMLKDAALAIAGGTVAGLLVNKIPVKDARIKAALPIAAGIALSGTLGQKNKLVMGVAQGMVVLGAVGLFKTLAPNVPFLAGEDAVPYIPYGIPYSPEALQMIPDASAEAVGYMGENIALGENVNLGYYSPADL